MIFEDGFFHADPHPGNFFIEPTAFRGLELAVPAFTQLSSAWRGPSACVQA
jgi:predicted unusual protein kinase regulating ubiquinone biosynthesis (AarF/ABC1/UbiB family)